MVDNHTKQRVTKKSNFLDRLDVGIEIVLNFSFIIKTNAQDA
jgi:hypothetical protein